MSISYENQRRFYRVDVNMQCTIRLRTLGTKKFATGEMFEGKVLNISGGGLSFETDRDLPVSELIAWQIVIEIAGEKVRLLGPLLWKHREGAVYRYGMKFLFVSDQEQHHLMRRINQVQALLRLREKSSALSQSVR
ncbi:MAG: PilZ domain-containing protein [Tumebacillaceae bacterium]